MTKAPDKLPNNEQPHTFPHRFKNAYDLHSRYNTVKNDLITRQTQWDNYIKAYNRWPYIKKNKKNDANFGQFKFKVDNMVRVYLDLITEREYWIRVLPSEFETKEQRYDWSEKISTCWHEVFIETWCERNEHVRNDIFDMIMFGKGIEYWPSQKCIYSESVPVTHVIPDKNACMNPEEWNLLFIRKQYTATELFLEIEDEETAKANGWNRQLVLEMLKSYTQFEKHTTDSIVDGFINGSLDANCTELVINLVFAYVLEYKKQEVNGREGRITQYVFREDGKIVDERSAPSKDNTERRYLKEFPAYAKDMSEVVGVRSFQQARSYWEIASFAESIFVSCQFHDQAMNRAIRSALRRNSIFLKSSNADMQEKLRNMTDDEIQVLNPDADIVTTSVSNDIESLMNVMRSVMYDTDRQIGQYLSTGSQNVKGKAITAEEVRANALKESDYNMTDMDMFVLQDTRYCKELYRRSLSDMITDEDDVKRQKKFRKKMKEYGIPASAYDPENVIINSVYNLAAGSQLSKNIQSKELLSLLMINPQDEGQERAKRAGVAALVGNNMVEYYMQKKEYLTVETRQIGMENEILSNPRLNPKDAQVLPTDVHAMHFAGHLDGYIFELKLCEHVFSQLKQAPLEQQPILVQQIGDILLALDNRGAHMEAHLQMLSQDQLQADTVRDMSKKLQEVRKIEANLENQYAYLLRSRADSEQNISYLTREQQIKLSSMQMELEHQQAMNDVALGKAVEKAELSKETQINRIQQQDAQAQVKFQQDVRQKELKNQAEIEKASLEIVKQKTTLENEQGNGGGKQKKGS